MYDLVDALFKLISEIGTERFTSVYLILQIAVLVGFIAYTLFRIQFREIRYMTLIWPELQEIQTKTNDTFAKINEIFSRIPNGSKYKTQWERYFNRASQKEVDEKIRIDPYLGEEVLVHNTGYRTVMDMVSGICVSVGVLGTFIGLSVGLADLHTENPEQIRSGITVLIGGMRVAFYTSVAGVVFSLLWMAYDRWISRRLEVQLDKHIERLDFLLNTDDEELFLNRLEKISRSQADHLKTVLTDALEKVMNPVVTHLQQSNQLMETQIQLQKTNSTDIATRLVDEITGGTQTTIQHFGELIQSTQHMQMNMMQTMDSVISGFNESEKKQSETASQTERMFQTFERMMAEMEQAQSHYTTTSSSISEISDTIQKLQSLALEQMPMQQSVLENNQRLAEKYEKISSDFSQFQKSMDEGHIALIERMVQFTSKLTEQYEQMTEQFGKSLQTQSQALRDSETMLKQLQELSRDITPQMKEIVGSMDSLSNGLREMQGIQSKLLPEITNMNMQTQDAVTNTLTASKNYMQQVDQQTKTLAEQWKQSGEQFTKTRETLDVALRGFAENIEGGLTKTYQHFDETLTNAVKGVANLVEELGDRQDEFVDEFEKLIQQISKLRKEVIRNEIA